MERFYNFTSVERVRIGVGAGRIVAVTREAFRYRDPAGAERTVDLEDCARTYHILQQTGAFPPRDDTDWSALAAAHPALARDAPARGCVGLRGAIDDPPWFQFLDPRRTQLEFKDYDAIQSELLAPLGRAGWQSFDAC